MFPFLGRLQRKAGLHKHAQGKHEDTIIASLLYRPSETGVQNHPQSLPQGQIDISEADTVRKIDTLILRALHSPNGLALVCIENFFTGLHLVHPLFDETVFRNRCKKELWCNRPRNVFKGLEALYYAVLALGALVSNADDFYPAILEHETGDLYVLSLSSTKRSTFNIPMCIARRCFEQAKFRLTDIFEVSNLERTQALYLLSVYCQNTLNPHSCHLYSGMAVTTGIAIGLPQGRAHQSFSFDIGPHTEPRSWWCIYAHEVEMSCASGRGIVLKPPAHYMLAHPADIQPPSTTRATHDMFINIMVSLAGLLRQVFEDLYQQYHFDRQGSRDTVRKLAQELDSWRMHLPPVFNFDRVSLTDPDHIRRQKVVLKIRYYNVQILLYRRYVETWSRLALVCQSAAEVNSCLAAAQKTIRLLFDTCQHESYFRTWWYNNTYLLNAAMVALAIAFIHLKDDSVDEIFSDVQKALDVFDAMSAITVARRCATVIKEVYEVTRSLAEKLKTTSESSTTLASNAGPDLSASGGTGVGIALRASMGAAPDSHSHASFQDSMLPEDIWSSIFETGPKSGALGFAPDVDFNFDFDIDSPLMG
ncbi:uncharacterized protein A1O9_09876 [Exophiala aquamarina CBS 119918]|uniref:Xylanolytic transcriptional activator regulatory domain-containing protein n=1 Tax=Exophiala aquamarina CBS 119918 TaxID=1182545 RepID=A0A072P2J6_9EURO|nr:uncharacterized protein A1O9_09876 [Exophiala aquamarina CBS 119918]KEF54081.1 hypothetical protein A1O9_09876 [Exophiala aquamarina CBS 119918]